MNDALMSQPGVRSRPWLVAALPFVPFAIPGISPELRIWAKAA